MDNIVTDLKSRSCTIMIGSCDIRYYITDKCEITSPSVTITIDGPAKVCINSQNKIQKLLIEEFLLIEDDGTSFIASHDNDSEIKNLYVYQGNIIEDLKELGTIENLRNVLYHKGVVGYHCVKINGVYTHYCNKKNNCFFVSYNQVYLKTYLISSLKDEADKAERKVIENNLKNKYNF